MWAVRTNRAEMTGEEDGAVEGGTLTAGTRTVVGSRPGNQPEESVGTA